MVRRALALAVGVTALLLPTMLPTAAISAGATPQLRLVGTATSASQASAVVVVPPELANLPVPASAFSLRQGDRQLPVSVQRLSAAGLDVYVVLDTAAANTALLAQQSAAADLLRQLPASARTAVVTSEQAVPAPEPGNGAALRALAAVKPGSAVVDRALNRVAEARVDGRRQLIVLLTSCPAASNTDLGALQTALGSGTSQLNIIDAGRSCRSRLLSLAQARGGLTLVGIAANQLAEAVDTIVYDALGQYRLSVPTPTSAAPVVVRVDFAGVHASTQVRLPAATGTDNSAAQGRAGGSGEAQLRSLLTALAGLLLLAVAAAAMWRTVTTGRAPRGRFAELTRQQGLPDAATQPVANKTDASAAPAPPAGDVGLAILGSRGERVATSEPALASAAAPAPPRDPAAAPLPVAALVAGLTDGVIRVRAPRRDDADALHALAAESDSRSDQWVPLPEDATEASCAALIDSWSKAWCDDHARGPGSHLGLVVERVSEAGMIGYVGLQVKADAIEITYGTAPQHRGHGHAKRAVRLVTRWLAQQEPARVIHAVIRPRDNVSRNVARDVGFVPDDIVRTFVPATGMVAVSLRFVLERRSTGPHRRLEDRRAGVGTRSSGPDRRVEDRRSQAAHDRRSGS